MSENEKQAEQVGESETSSAGAPELETGPCLTTGSGHLKNDNLEGQSSSQKASLLFRRSFVDHYPKKVLLWRCL